LLWGLADGPTQPYQYRLGRVAFGLLGRS
jgi:hypothetical protein